MIQIDLITGFLGSGKTTFIKRYASYLMGQGKRIGILENDFGAVNVDMLLLQDLEAAGCGLEMIAGGCDQETHRRRFRTKLIAMGMSGYDRVLIEPSGIYDVDEFFDTLYEEPLDQWYEAGNVITVVDARLEEGLSPEEDYLLASEAAKAGCVIFSRCQEASEEEMAGTLAHLNRALEQIKCSRRLSREDVLCKAWSDLTDEDFARLSSCGYCAADYQKLDFRQNTAFESLYFMNQRLSLDKLEENIKALMEDPACGRIFRVKGFAKEADGSWLQINATRRELTKRPIATGQEVLIVIGTELSKARIAEKLGKEE